MLPERESEAILAAFGEFMSAITWPDIEEALERHPELTSELADVILSALARAQTSSQQRRNVEDALALFRRAREIGIRPALREAQGPLAAVREFIEARSDAAKFEVVRRSPELLDPQTDAILAQIADDQTDPDARRQVERERALLRDFRRRIAAGAARPEPDPEDHLQEGLRLRVQYDDSGDLADLDAAIRILEESVAAMAEDHPTRPLAMSSLGTSLRRRYVRIGDIADLDRGIELMEQAIALSDDASLLINCTTGLIARYDRTSRLEDLNRTIEYCERALPHAGPAAVIALNNLGIGLRRRYLHTGEAADLDRAISIWERGIALARNEAFPLAQLLSNITSGYFDRFHRTGALSDLDGSVRAGREALKLTRSGAPDRSMAFYNLGGSLLERYQVSGELDDLVEGARALQEAVRSTPAGASEMPMFLAGLGNALAELHRNGRGDQEYLSQAIEAFEQSVRLTPAASPIRPRHLSNLSHALSRRYLDSGGAADQDRSIALLQEALATSLSHGPEWCLILSALAEEMRRRWHRTGSEEDRTAAVGRFEQAARESIEIAPGSSLRAALNWGHWAFGRQAWSEVVQAHEWVREARERLSAAQLDRESKRAWLEHGQGFTARAAYACVMLEQVRDAVMVLELGRTRLLAESLERDRADLESLMRDRPELVTRYRAAAERVALSGRDPSLESREAIRETRQLLNDAIEAIRSVAGYEQFLRPPSWDEIEQIIESQPPESAVVYVLVTSHGALGIIAAPGWIEAVPLNLTEQTLDRLLVSTADGTVVGGYLPGQFEARSSWLAQALDDLLPALGQLLLEPLAERLRMRGIGRITVMPLGRLALVPLHAARYGDRSLLDDFVVTYAPSLRPLASVRRRASDSAAPAHLFALANPAPHPSPLRGAEAEVREIESLVADSRRIVLYGTDVQRERVLDAMTAATHLHFSCHGVFIPHEPLSSHLQLGGGEVLTIRDLLDRNARPRRARLAVLSACQTAVTDFQSMPDELVGMPAAFLEAGVPGVVGTLWSVDDFSTALVMIRLYELLLRDALPPAEALRGAQRWLRDATAEEIAAFGAAHPALATAFRQSQARGEASALAAIDNLSPGERPFANRPFHWASFVYFGA